MPLTPLNHCVNREQNTNDFAACQCVLLTEKINFSYWFNRLIFKCDSLFCTKKAYSAENNPILNIPMENGSLA